MPFTSYTELLDKLQEYLPHEDASPEVAADLVTLGEARFNREIRARQMVTLRTPAALPAGGVVTLPSDYLAVAAHYIASSPRAQPTYLPPNEFLVSEYQYQSTGLPKVYTVLGDSIMFAPSPDSPSYDYYLWYFQKLTALSEEDTTNWLLTFAPDIYLYGCLIEGEVYFLNDERLAVWTQLYGAAKHSLGATDIHSRHAPGARARATGVTIT